MADVALTFPEFSIGDRMRKARESVGINSAERMADLLNAELNWSKPIKVSTVNAWERNANQPRRFNDVINAYATICSRVGKDRGIAVSRAWLYGIDSRQSSPEKSERASHLQGLPRNEKLAKSKPLGRVLMNPIPASV